MRRAVQVVPLFTGDASRFSRRERYVLNVARAVAATGRYKVEIAACGNVAVPERSLDDGVSATIMAPSNGRSGEQALSWGLLPLLQGADVVHVHEIFSRPGEAAVLMAKVLGRPLCGTDHRCGTSPLGRSLGMLDLLDRIICYSEFGRTLLSTASTVTVVPGCVDERFFSPSHNRPARDRLLFVGRLIPSKGIDRLIRALPAGVRLTVCGRRDHEHYLEMLRSLASGRQVEFITDADDARLRELYRDALAVILPSVHRDVYGVAHDASELAGLVLLEAMACGTPVVCSPLGALPELVEDGVTGFLVDGDAQLRARLAQLSADRSLVERLGENARAHVVNRFGSATTGDRMAALYDELAVGDGRQ